RTSTARDAGSPRSSRSCATKPAESAAVDGLAVRDDVLPVHVGGVVTAVPAIHGIANDSVVVVGRVSRREDPIPPGPAEQRVASGAPAEHVVSGGAAETVRTGPAA